MRRSQAYRARRRKRGRMLLTAVFCCVVGAAAVFVLPRAAVNRAKNADTAAVECAEDQYGQVMNQIPAGEPDNGAGMTSAYDAESGSSGQVIIEIHTEPESEEWVYTDPDQTAAILEAIRQVQKQPPASFSAGELNGMCYTITVTEGDEVRCYTLFGNALYFADEDSWAGLDEETYRQLVRLITQEGD